MAGKGRTGGKRHKGGKRSALDRITNGSIRRLARRGGVKRISSHIYNDTRQVIH
jgi:histone H4